MKTICLTVCLLVLTAGGLASCSGEPPLAGTYTASRPGAADDPVVLVLGDGGNGSWSLEGETVDLRWETRRAMLLLHTRSGGVITGTVSPAGAIEIHLPGEGPLRFIKRAGGG